MTQKFKKILALDFDGVIHSYTPGWQGPRTIPDPPVPFAINWITRFMMTHCGIFEDYTGLGKDGDWELNIFSSRARHIGGRRAMKKYLVKHGLPQTLLDNIKIPRTKPPAQILIDDRAMQFTGEFPAFETITDFVPWNKEHRRA